MSQLVTVQIGYLFKLEQLMDFPKMFNLFLDFNIVFGLSLMDLFQSFRKQNC